VIGRFQEEQPDENLMVSNVLCVLDKGYTLKQVSKVNRLREQAGLAAID